MAAGNACGGGDGKEDVVPPAVPPQSGCLGRLGTRLLSVGGRPWHPGSKATARSASREKRMGARGRRGGQNMRAGAGSGSARVSGVTRPHGCHPRPPAAAHRGARTRRLRRGTRPAAQQRGHGQGEARQTAGRAGWPSPPGRLQSPPPPHSTTTTTHRRLPRQSPPSPTPPVALPHHQPPPLGLVNVGLCSRAFFGLALRAPVCARTTSIKPNWKRICRGGRPRWGVVDNPP